MGQVQGANVVWQSAYSANISTTPVEVWSGSGSFNFPGSASQISVASTDASDNQNIQINGLDSNWLEVSEVVTLNGITSVSTVNSFIRVNSCYNVGASELVGNVNGSIGADVVFNITPEAQRTSQAVYSIPDNKTAYLFQGTASSDKNDGIDFIFKVRQFGGVFTTEEQFRLFENIMDTARPFSAIPKKSDLKVMAQSVAGTNKATAQFGLLLLDDAIWKND